MRFPAAYYLMLLYLTVMFKPLIPVIRDAYSHTFGEANHLATVHAKYSNNHLEQALANTGSENNKNQKNLNPAEDFQVHVKSVGCLYNFYLDRIENTFCIIKFRRLSDILLQKVFPPPR